MPAPTEREPTLDIREALKKMPEKELEKWVDENFENLVIKEPVERVNKVLVNPQEVPVDTEYGERPEIKKINQEIVEEEAKTIKEIEKTISEEKIDLQQEQAKEIDKLSKKESAQKAEKISIFLAQLMRAEVQPSRKGQFKRMIKSNFDFWNQNLDEKTKRRVNKLFRKEIFPLKE